MTAVKKAAPQKKALDDNQLIGLYMNQVLQNNAEPKNVFLFCQENKIAESDFYAFYGSIDALKQDIWVKFFENVKTTIENDENYLTYSNKNKLLTLYFSLFEVLTLNRSYVVFALKEDKNLLKNLHQLKEFRKHFKNFIAEIADTQTTEEDFKVNKITKPLYVEGAWVEFLFLMKFWLDDTSKGFEKTDIMIEKAVKATFDVLNTTPIDSLIDLGKFVWKEKFN
ncbi:TetR family transcriptional regulator C-terminal domain-containing protein [Flavobacterium sp.]|uniref:TetR family transcriptional regulator C-terminal domain-containing protein n=1 Tax=Flavobacterium sp. TaxID=239 RepID=UPI0025C5FE19|nr:TetR family transcriptional regulator C-terminal domain-containing protein [Flavobacterium sp.]MBA4155476.1 heat-shock protein [Flavobacterium sp.]